MTDDLPPEARQFDFWLGEWAVTWGDGEQGTNIIRAVLDDRVILENFDGEQATPLRGMSVSTYNVALGQWQQTWVDNQGSYLDFVGELQDDQMILVRDATLNGKPIMQRMVWYNITTDELDWNWERSEDAGATWSLQWHIHYHRKGVPAGVFEND